MAGGGDVRVVGGNQRVKGGVAFVTGHALHVRIVAGGGGGVGNDVNIIEVGGVPVGGPSVPINDAGGSLTVDGTVRSEEHTSELQSH